MSKTRKGLPEQYPRIYAKCKKIGFSPARAIEILLDAKRKDKLALEWVRLVKRWQFGDEHGTS